eukprot:350185-Chlamydomonas_euryale.AAC.3
MKSNATHGVHMRPPGWRSVGGRHDCLGDADDCVARGLTYPRRETHSMHSGRDASRGRRHGSDAMRRAMALCWACRGALQPATWKMASAGRFSWFSRTPQTSI